jgi:glutamyl-tRNA synthetase
MKANKTRFCPSPTGLLHLGNLRTALFSSLLAKKHGGSFLLRIEDTDLERSKKEFSEAICEDLEWMGLDWDEGPRIGGKEDSYYQSDRINLYESFYKELLDRDLIYPCFTSEEELKIIRRNQIAAGQPPRYTGVWSQASKEEIQKELDKGNEPVYRFRIPKEHKINFTDLVKGDQSFSTADLDDFIIRKKDSTPTFMFANAIDDSLMEVDLVVRGDDHLSNTPRQIVLLEALGLNLPQYAHVSLFTGSDGAPLSKRNGSLSIKDLREMGYLPRAVANYLSRVGHTIADNDLKSLQELANAFETKNISSSPSKFDIDQLLFWQKKTVESLTTQECANWLQKHLEELPLEINLEDFVELIKDNINFPQEAKTYLNNLFYSPLGTDSEIGQIIQSAGRDFYLTAINILEPGFESWGEVVKIIGTESEKKGKDLFMPLRASITGQMKGPELDKVVDLIGLERVIGKLKEASEI